MIARRCSQWAVLGAVTALSPMVSAKATFVVQVTDDDGVGFNDTTLVAPVGGNTGTTLGKQRLIAFQAAADAWGRVLESDVPIVIDASFAPLTCTSSGAVLGHAAPYTISNSAKMPTRDSYPLALVDKILGYDLFPDDPDIVAQFNGGLKACMDVDWYYGLDGKRGENDSDLLTTVMHELGHGLGFSAGVDPTSGSFASDYASVFSNYVLDTSTNKYWSAMTAAERKTSLANARNVVWDGKRVQAVAAWALAKGMPSVQVAPALSSFTGNIGEANFGRFVADASSITASIQTGAITSTSTSPCTFSGSFPGKIALISAPSTCASIGAARVVEKSGGLAMLFAYDAPGNPPDRSLEFDAATISQFGVTIPTLALTRADAALIRGASASTATLSADKGRLVGADASGRTLLYASDPIQSGSTGSHWDPLVRPNLVLEPVEQPTSVSDLVMERALLWDIGWTGKCGNGTVDGQEECDNGVANSDRTPDACRLDCKRPKCGDGIVDTGEVCDPGSAGVGTAPNPSCSSDCKTSTAVSTGGSVGSGGRAGAGGSLGSGGRAGAGGSAGSGGAGAGGSAGSGGSSEGSGGASANGGETSASTASHPGGSSGCSCSLSARPRSAPLAFAWMLSVLALLAGRRHRTAEATSRRRCR